MTVTAKTLINTKLASATDNTEYTTPGSTTTIIDKMTVTNTDSSARTLTVYLVPSGQSASATYIIVKAQSVSAGQCYDLTELKNHILSTGDFIVVGASVAAVMVIRASGREIT